MADGPAVEAAARAMYEQRERRIPTVWPGGRTLRSFHDLPPYYRQALLEDAHAALAAGVVADEARLKAAEAVCRSAQEVETVSDDGETETFMAVSPSLLEVWREAVSGD